MTDAPSPAGEPFSRIDRAQTFVDATPEEVYAALLDSGALEAWLPPDGATAEITDLDARPGGGFRAVLRFADPVDPKTTTDSDVTHVRFVELRPGRLVEQAVTFDSSDPRFGGTMRMTWRIEPSGGRTRVTVSATDVPVGIGHAEHEAGLTSSLANLAAYLSR